MFDTYYTDKIEYMTFFEAMIEEQRDMEDYVNECITLTDHNKKIFNEFQVFNEAKFGDKVKALFNRFRSFFSKIWQKFLEKLRAWVNNNKEYLETYKDIIIGKKVKLNNIKMPDHFQEGWPRIKQVIDNVTEFSKPLGSDDFNLIEMQSNSNSGEGSTAEKKAENISIYKLGQYKKLFEKLKIDTSKVSINDDEDLASVSPNLTTFLKGSENEFDAEDLTNHMKEMFTTIYSYNETYDGLKKIQDTFQTAMTKSEQAYDKAFNEIKDLISKNAAAQKAANEKGASTEVKKAADASAQKLDTEIQKAQKNQKDTAEKIATSNNSQNNEAYKYISGTYINESEVQITNTSSSASTTSTNNSSGPLKGGGGNVSTAGASQSAKAQAASMKSKNDTVKSATGDVKADASAMGAGHAANLYSKNKNIDAAKLNEFQTHATNLINAYSSCRITIFGATLNAIQATRDDYMTVIRMHVQSYVGTVNDTGDNTSTTTV